MSEADTLELPESLTGVPRQAGDRTFAPAPEPRMEYDINAALKAEVPLNEIADFLGGKKNYDVKAARAAGLTDNDIVAELAGLKNTKGFMSQAATGAVAGATKTAPMIGGAIAGGKIGAALGAPFLGPLGAIAGGALGVLGGSYAGYKAGEAAQEVSKKLGGADYNEMAPDARAAYVAGDTFGSSIAPTPFAAALPVVKAAGPVGRAITGIGESARAHPLGFAAAESGRGLYSSEAAFISESMSPDEPLHRALAEGAAGLINPGSVLIHFAPSLKGAAGRALSAVDPRQSAQTRRAGAELEKNLATYGEDPQQLVDILAKADIPGVATTAGQRTGSRTLMALENFLGRENRKFSTDVEIAGRQAREVIEGALDKMAGSSDPQVLQHAAELRTRYFNTLLQKRLDDAERTAQEAMALVAPADRMTRSELSVQASASVQEALKASRKVEADLWGALPSDIAIPTPNFIRKWNETVADMVPTNEGTFSTKILVDRLTATVARLEDNDGGDKMKLLRALRSDYLGDARIANAGGDFINARRYSDMAGAILEDFDAYGAGKPAYDAARTWSRELNDVFTRSFARDATRTSRQGGDNLAPELLLSRAFAGGREAGALRTRQLDEAVNFPGAKGAAQLGEEGTAAAKENAKAFQQAEENFLRTMASETVTDGVVNPTKLLRFVKTHSETLARFPQVAEELKTATSAAQATKALSERMKVINPLLADKNVTAFARLSGFADPTLAVAQAVASGNPPRSLATLARFAGRDPATKQGLQSAVFDYARKEAAEGDTFSFYRYSAALENPPGRGLPSVMQVMQKNGIVDGATATRMRELLTRGMTIETAMKNKESADRITGSSSMLMDVLARLTGSYGGAQAAGVTGGQSLVWAGIGSSAARKMLSTMNITTVADLLRRAATDSTDNYGLMRTLLTQAKTPRERATAIRQLHGYLLNAGLTAVEGDDGENP